MTKRMLIDASHPEETRLVVMDGNRIEDFDVEAADRLPLKGNIYLAKVVRVEPSLQAAFVEYGGNRHGFLAFSEIHPDYYQIPVADRQRLLEMQAMEAEEEDEDEAELDTAAERPAPEDDRDLRRRDAREGRSGSRSGRQRSGSPASPEPAGTETAAPEEQAGAALTPAADVVDSGPHQVFGEAIPEAPREAGEETAPLPAAAPSQTAPAQTAPAQTAPAQTAPAQATTEAAPSESTAHEPAQAAPGPDGEQGEARAEDAPEGTDDTTRPGRAQPMSMHVDQVSEGDPVREAGDALVLDDAPEIPPETLGGDAEGNGEEERGRERRIPPRFLRHYKIQEVIRRRQIMLVQVVKEERGNKGAALTTYISLAGRFSVLMPNSPRGGGVSRKITQVADRKRLREAVEEMNLPKGMSIIVRTAGAQRPKPEIRRDGEYLLRLWDDIRERTMHSTAPALIYEEADLIKRSLRDSYGRDIDDVEVEGEAAWKQARDFMRMIMPQHERRVRLYRDPVVPLFVKAGVEQQLDAMMSPVVQLRSGGYIVINQTEALVAIDVNSGRNTRDRHIEDTALRTNMEAAEEIARQLRLRDLAGLIVIDFIDMESSKHDAQVERRLKESLRTDRARIQVGRISHFGLLEMSRQRLRPSLTEHAFMTCPHCQGRGIVRSLESSALHVLRGIEEEGAKRRASEILVHAAEPVAMHILNNKREWLANIEARFNMHVMLAGEHEMSEAQFRIERLKAQTMPAPQPANHAPALRMDYAPEPVAEEPEETEELEAEAVTAEEDRPEGKAEEKGENGRRRRRRRRGGRREGGDRPDAEAEGEGEAGDEAIPADEAGPPDQPSGEAQPAADTAGAEAAGPDGEKSPEAQPDERGEESRSRRRGRRGGRRRQEEGADQTEEQSSEPAPRRGERSASRYTGPTPADPFGGAYDPVMDALAAAEAAAEAAARRLTTGELPPLAVSITTGPPPEAPAVLSGEDVAPQALEAPAVAGVEETVVIANLSEAVVEAPAPEAAASEAPASEVAIPEAEAPAATTPETPATEPAGAEPDTTGAMPDTAGPVVGEPVKPVVLDGTSPSQARRAGWWRR
ncbi:Rne/Rng family ribonuclease [Roseomonas gilardii subsp. gilardii]|uniref:Rne/Rng family ribonuclease n=1 Tax=Roseomonas gilardii TaxID=257708 RepID=UPI001FF86A0D|nr:ribonuclease E/G [Roseomonas gilardii]UPG74088.1 Rne/Rng family ribonuclease [Roseomonas gilardii subsp. gilardii]